MEPVEGVALHALLLREAGRNRHLDPDAVADDVACEIRQLSMASLLAYEHFGPLEWRLAQLLYRSMKQRVEYRLCRPALMQML